MDEEVTVKQKRLDALVRMRRSNMRRLYEKAHEDAINKLPNEFRERKSNWNPFNLYHGDSYAGLYADESD